MNLDSVVGSWSTTVCTLRTSGVLKYANADAATPIAAMMPQRTAETVIGIRDNKRLVGSGSCAPELLMDTPPASRRFRPFAKFLIDSSIGQAPSFHVFPAQSVPSRWPLSQCNQNCDFG